MGYPGPLSQEAIDQDAYWGGAGISSPASVPVPATPVVPPPAPAAPAVPFGNVNLANYFGPAPANSAPTPEPASTWNPAEQTTADAARFMGKPAPPSVGVPSVTSLRSGSAAMNAEMQGAPPKGQATPEQERAAAALAHFGGAPLPGTKPKGSGGGGGPSGPSAYDKANAAMRGTYDADKDALQRGTNADKDKADLIASGAADIARTKMEDQAIEQVEAANAAKHFEDYSAETQRQIDDVRSQTIQPNRAYADSGEAALAWVGGVLGGIYQGLNHLSSNPAIDQMNRVIDRDIAAQEHDQATKKGAIAERKGLLADMRATYKDEALAKIQAKNLYYEAAKEQLAAEAATYDSPAIQARADQAITALTREQTKLDINEAIRKAAAAQAAAAAAEHRRQVDFENSLKLQDMRNKTVTADAQASKDLRAGDEKTDEQTAHLGTELSKPELVEAKKTIDDLKRKLTNPKTGQVDGTVGIPGVGPAGDTRERLAPRPTGLSALRPDDWLAYGIAGHDDENRVGRLEWQRLGLAYKHAVTGAGGSDKEAEGIQSAFAGASTPAEQAAAIRLADAAIAERESRIRAGAPRKAVDKYDARLSEEHTSRTAPVRREAVK